MFNKKPTEPVVDTERFFRCATMKGASRFYEPEMFSLIYVTSSYFRYEGFFLEARHWLKSDKKQLFAKFDGEELYDERGFLTDVPLDVRERVVAVVNEFCDEVERITAEEETKDTNERKEAFKAIMEGSNEKEL